MSLTPIKDKKKFEHFCKWVARDNFGPNVFLYSKYVQNGIDIYWNDKGKYNVIQCKQRNNPRPSELIRSLEKDFEKALMYFNADLNQFIFATTASLQTLETKIKRQNGSKESLLDVCVRLSNEFEINIIAWHWDYLEEKVLESPFLLKHLLDCKVGADLINNDFLERYSFRFKGISKNVCKLEYYGGQEDIQWYGVLQNFDAPRKIYDNVVKNASSSFERSEPVAMVIRGDGGSGKSVFLRRIAVDLSKKYTIYWLNDNIEAFINNELIYDIYRHPDSNYILILEDWYRNIERIGNKVIANQLLAAIKKAPNARLIIGDRKHKNKIYDDFVDVNHIYDFHNSENIETLQNIFEKMPRWKGSLSEKEIRNITGTSLFIALFVFCYGEHNDKEKLTSRYRKIFKSDYNKFLERHDPFEKIIANCLYIYANIYSNYGITMTPASFVELISYYSSCSVPGRYRNNIPKLFELPLLKKYLHIEEVGHPNGVVSKVRFHHDTMAELGWSSHHELVDIEYEQNTINDFIVILRKCNHTFDLGLLCRSYSIKNKENSREVGYEYLSVEKSYENPFVFSHFLKLLKAEKIAKEKALEFIKTDKSYLYPTAFCTSVELLKEDKITKDKALEFLKSDKPYQYQEVFCKCLELLKKEEVAKDKALDFFNSDKPYQYEKVFCKCFELLRKERIVKDVSIEFLKIEKPYSYPNSFLKAIVCFQKEKIVKIVEEFLKIEKPYRYRDIFVKSLELLAGEKIAKDKANEFLKTDKPYQYQDIYIKSLELLADEKITKNKVRLFLKTDKPHLYPHSFFKSLELLKKEKIAKDKAREFLKSDKPYLYQEVFIISLQLLRREKISKEKANEFIKSEKAQIYKYAFLKSLEFLRNEKHA